MGHPLAVASMKWSVSWEDNRLNNIPRTSVRFLLFYETLGLMLLTKLGLCFLRSKAKFEPVECVLHCLTIGSGFS